jgi:hypothetical protein
MSKAFTEFEVTPMAAASLGQVHRARLRDGRQVAVKVQRPGIREALLEDLDALDEIARFLDDHNHRWKALSVLSDPRSTSQNPFAGTRLSAGSHKSTTIGANRKSSIGSSCLRLFSITAQRAF